MSGAIIFKELPATFPERDKYRKPSIVSSIVFHGLLIVTLLLVPMFIHESISEEELWITLVSPLPPPPGAPVPAPPQPVAAAAPAPKAVKAAADMLRPEALVMPTEIPAEIARIIEEPVKPAGVIGGVPGGAPGGAMGSVLGRLLSASTGEISAPPPPPPPPPPPAPVLRATPVRVGGMIREPRLVKLVQPVYPRLAAKARVMGTVVLEATLSVVGTVEEIRVVSGHPLLLEAAIDCVKRWRYEPTLLNGTPVPVILTARVIFAYKPIS